ncbi:MAG: TolC family protein [Gemmatimonadales bacterium]
MRWALVAVLLLTVARPAVGQAPLRLSIDDVLRRADSASEAVGIARAGVRGAGGRLTQARSAWLPQLTGSASYTRTLETQFSALQSSGGDSAGPRPPAPVDCTRFTPRPGLTVAERLDSLERGLDCTANGNGGIDFSNLPFGQANAWSFGLQLRQTLFDRSVPARVRSARAGEDQADAAYDAARAQATLDAATSYYDARLADRLLAIAESTLVQSERQERETELAGRVGNAAEFDVLRAQVARQNQVPVVAQRRSQREVAYLRLRQALDLAEDQPLELVTPLDDTAAVALPAYLHASEALPDPAARAGVREADAAARAAEASRDAAAGGRWPTVALTSSYAKLAYPRDVFRFGTFLTDWTAGVQVSVPLFTGGRVGGQVREAEAAADAARLRARQVLEGARREAAEVRTLYDAALASFAASEGTAAQARRAYEIAEIRVREGLSTLTDLADVRLQLQQAEANWAQAARDLQVARLRLRLLRDLPIGTATAGRS